MDPKQEVRPSLEHVTWRPPTLVTERTLMRGWELSDAEAIFAYASDPEVTRYMAWERHRTIGDTHAFLSMTADDYQHEELSYALCSRAEPGVAIGGVGAYWRSRRHRVMELGYVLARPYWGNSYMPEAARALVRHCFATTDVHRIYAPIFADNVKSRRAAEKIGMTLDGVLRSSLELRGRRWDEAVYSILRDDPG